MAAALMASILAGYVDRRGTRPARHARPTGGNTVTMLELNLLGVPEVTLDGHVLTFTRRGSVALLGYLALSRRAHAREALATLLAGDSFEEQARKYLSNVLVDLRQQLGDYIIATRQSVSFDRRKAHRLDVVEFQARAADCEHSSSLTDLQA